jgi:tRNA(Ile)-lysidine synthase
MLERFRSFIDEHTLFEPKDRVLLAVSGGVDSMVMVHLFIEAGFDFGVAHCNFQLRGKESAEDQVFIADYCHKRRIPFFTEKFIPKNYAEEAGISVQMAAREQRYAWFTQILEKENYHWLATAHHLNDNIETVLFRWVNGGGLDQLTGIPIKNDRVVRPLLFATRSEIDKYALDYKVKWREDSSNASDDYSRNFIRHEVIPRLREINPSMEKTFAGAIEKLKGARELMGRALDQLRDGITKTEGNQFFIDINLLLLLKNPVFVCYEWLRPMGFDWDRCSQLVASLHGQSGKKFLSATHEAVVDREYVIVGPVGEWSGEVFIEEGQDKAGLGPWVLAIKKTDDRNITRDSSHASFDASKLRFPVLWRKWKHGDSFFPLGMKHKKKVSDLLIDDKVPITEKTNVTVLESQGEIIWVAGYRIDDRYKITDQTKSVLEITLRRV